VTLPVFYLASANSLAVGDLTVLEGDEGHHAATVRRLRPAEAAVLTDGSGTALECRVAGVGRHEVTFEVTSTTTVAAPPLTVTVVQALAKGDRGERAVEMLTEVGVHTIVPWQAERSVSRWQGDKLDRGRSKWKSAAAEAAKQSRRVWWPRVAPAAGIAEVVTLLEQSDFGFILHEEAEVSLAASLDGQGLSASGTVVLVVGPEGGISEHELAQLQAAGGSAVRLGDTVLRTSTAGVVAASLVLSRTPAWHVGSPREQRSPQ
jgi:16S rRNA (uracil1498-N3)-methyltransferase